MWHGVPSSSSLFRLHFIVYAIQHDLSLVSSFLLLGQYSFAVLVYLTSPCITTFQLHFRFVIRFSNFWTLFCLELSELSSFIWCQTWHFSWLCMLLSFCTKSSVSALQWFMRSGCEVWWKYRHMGFVNCLFQNNALIIKPWVKLQLL